MAITVTDRRNCRYTRYVQPIQLGVAAISNNALIAQLASTAIIVVAGSLAPSSAIAQQEVVNTLEEVVVLGTRRQGRTAVETPVPVDVFNRQDIECVSSDDMLDIIRTLVPSFQVQRYPIDDGATFVRPPTLRGMSADKILVLVNGKRRHRSALVQLSGDGVHGPDLATIPSTALKSIEVLRDGASAMYGSDAIAGVFNFNLRDSAEGGEVRLQTGMYTEGNESGYLLSFNQGLSLGGNGFVNISAELSDNEPTSRGTFFTRGGFSTIETAQVSGLFDHDRNPGTPDQQRFGPDALTEVYDPVSGEFITLARGSDGIPDDLDTRYADYLPFAEVSDSQLVQIWGVPERKAFNSFINAGLELGGGRELYGWANYSYSDSNGSFFHRTPAEDSLAPLRTETGQAIFHGRRVHVGSDQGPERRRRPGGQAATDGEVRILGGRAGSTRMVRIGDSDLNCRAGCVGAGFPYERPARIRPWPGQCVRGPEQ